MGDDSGEPISCIALLSVDVFLKRFFFSLFCYNLVIFGDKGVCKKSGLASELITRVVGELE